MEKLNKWASSQDGGLSRYASFLHTTKMKDNNQFKNKKQPELPEKSNHMKVPQPRNERNIHPDW